MPITEKQREARRRGMMATDVAEIMIGSPYKVWLSKIHRIDAVSTEAMRIGTILEASILTWAEFDADIKIARRGVYRVVHDAPIRLGAHLDAVTNDGVPLEAKTAGIRSVFTDLSQWGEAGTDEIPDRTKIQCHVQMMATGSDHAHVAALIGGRGFVLFHLERYQPLCDMIVESSERFWRDHVMSRQPPPMDQEGETILPLLKKINRRVGSMINLKNDQCINHWEAVRSARLLLEKMERGALAQVLSELGDAEAAELPDGRIFSYRRCHRKTYTVPASSYPVARITKPERRLTYERTSDHSLIAANT